MKVTVNSPSDTKRELLIEVPVDIVEKAVDKETEKVRRKIQIPGFRKGKAPKSIIFSQYGAQIQSTAVEDTINIQYRKAVDAEDIVPLGTADISDLDWEPGKPLKFKASVDIEPEIVIESWDGMRVDKEVTEVSEEIIEDSLKRLQVQYATLKTKEEPAEEGDKVVLDVQEVDPSTGVKIIGKQFSGREMRLGENAYGPELDEHIIGMKTGETRIIRRPVETGLVVEPGAAQGNRPSEEAFQVDIKSVESVELPELNDEFAKEMKYDNFDGFREGVKLNLQRQFDDAAKRNFRNALESEAVRIISPSAPDSMIDRYLDGLIENLKRMSNKPVDNSKIREENREYAAKKVRWILIRQKLIEMEKLEVTEQETDDFLKKIAEESSIDYDRLKIEYRSGQKREDLKLNLLDDKVFDFLESKTEVTEIKQPAAADSAK